MTQQSNEYHSDKDYPRLRTILLFKIIISCLLCISDQANCLNDDKLVKSRSETSKTEQKVFQARFNEIGRLRDRCGRAEQSLDTCSAQLIEFTRGELESTGGSVDELNSTFCPKFKEVVSCIKNYTDCYKPFERQIINWVLTSTRRMNYKRCNDENEKQRFLRLTQSCFRTMKSPMSKCMSTYISNLEAIANMNHYVERLSEDDIQIQLSCCANMRFKQCVMTNAKNYCTPTDSLRKLQRANSLSSQRVVHKYLQRSTMDTVADIKKVLDSMALTGPEFICQNVDENFCQTKFDGKFKVRKPRHKSIVPAMLNIYSNRPM